MAERILAEHSCGIAPVLAELDHIKPYVNKNLPPDALGAISVAVSIMSNVPTHLWVSTKKVHGSTHAKTRYATDPIPLDIGSGELEPDISVSCARVIFDVDRNTKQSSLAKFGDKIKKRVSEKPPERAVWQIMLGNMCSSDLKKINPSEESGGMVEESRRELPSLVIPLIGNVTVLQGLGTVVESGKVTRGVVQHGTREEAAAAFLVFAVEIDEAMLKTGPQTQDKNLSPSPF